MARPTPTTFTTVPSPGTIRRGTHSSRTTTPVTIDAPPSVSGVCTDSPWWKTSYGARPAPERAMSAMPREMTVSPTTRRGSRVRS